MKTCFQKICLLNSLCPGDIDAPARTELRTDSDDYLVSHYPDHSQPLSELMPDIAMAGRF